MMNKKTLQYIFLSITIFLIIIFHYNSHRFIGTYYLKKMGVISSVETIQYQQAGRYTILAGRDSENRKKMIWLSFRDGYFSPKMKYQLFSDQGLTKDDAYKIIEDNNLLETFLSLEIVIVDEFLVHGPLTVNTPYWKARDKNTRNVYINFFTGEYLIFD